MNRTVTLAVTQMTCSPESQENQDRGEYLVRDAASKGAKIILLQELFEHPYFCKGSIFSKIYWRLNQQTMIITQNLFGMARV